MQGFGVGFFNQLAQVLCVRKCRAHLCLLNFFKEQNWHQSRLHSNPRWKTGARSGICLMPGDTVARNAASLYLFV